MPEVHIIGELLGGSGFKDNNLFAQWKIITEEESRWELIRGHDTGTTHLDAGNTNLMNTKSKNEMQMVWSSPINVQYASSSLSGWPKLYVEVWHQDGYGRNVLVSYGFCHIPAASGSFHLDIVTWSPSGTTYMEKCKGSGPQLLESSTVYTTGDRFELNTISKGLVFVQLQILHRELIQHGSSVGA